MKIFILDDYPLTAMGTENFLRANGYQDTKIYNNPLLAFEHVCKQAPQIILMDISMPNLNGLEFKEQCNTLKINSKVIFMTMHNDYAIYSKAKAIGANGYVLKEYAQEELLECMDSVMDNNFFVSKYLIHNDKKKFSERSEFKDLTNSEKKILELIILHKTSKEIADILFISMKTVEGHRKNIIDKLGLPKEKNSLLKWALSNNFAMKSEN